MTASLYVTGTHVGSFEPRGTGDRGVAHAVARPVVDGLDQAVCGVLVSATADRDWRTLEETPRCEECRRIAG